jgi:phage/plasmid-associated DNA primase
MPGSSLEAIRQLENLASPVQAFISEWCTVGTGQRVMVKTLYGAFRAWCESDGIKPDGNIVFGRNLRALLPQVRARDKGEHRFYDGITLNAHGQENYEEAQQTPSRRVTRLGGDRSQDVIGWYYCFFAKELSPGSHQCRRLLGPGGGDTMCHVLL